MMTNSIKKIVLFLFLAIGVFFASLQSVYVYGNSQVNLSVSLTSRASGAGSGIKNSGNTNVIATPSFNRLSRVSIDPPANSEIVFAFVNGVYVPNFNISQYPVKSIRNDINLITRPTTGDHVNEKVVVFIDLNGALIQTWYVTEGQSLADETIDISNITQKPGLNVDASNKWRSIQGSSSLSDIREHSIFRLQYTPTTISGTHTISLQNGTVNNASSATFSTGALATVTATEVPNQFFDGWYEEDVKISGLATFSFTVIKNRQLVARYSENPVTQLPIVSFQGPIEILAGRISHVGQVYVPEGYTLIEHGFVISTDNGVVPGLANTITAQSRMISPNNEFMTNFTLQTHQAYRAYAVFERDVNGTLEYETLYSGFMYRKPTALNTSVELSFSMKNVDNLDVLLSNPSNPVILTSAVAINDGYQLSNNSNVEFNVPGLLSGEFTNNNSSALNAYDSVSLEYLNGSTWTNLVNLKEETGVVQFELPSEAIGSAIRIISTGTGENLSFTDLKFVVQMNFTTFYELQLFNVPVTPQRILLRLGETLPVPTKEGHTFSNWFTDIALSNTLTDGIFTQSAQRQYYPGFTINNYTISFNTDGGTAVSSITQAFGTVVTKPTNPTKTGLPFGGWYINSDFTGSVYTFNTMPSENITLFAKWLNEQESVNQIGNEIFTIFNPNITESNAVVLTTGNQSPGARSTAINNYISSLASFYGVTITITEPVKESTGKLYSFDMTITKPGASQSVLLTNLKVQYTN
jgi:uncharacterized repeat protein (TIGR02543 family)